MKIKIQLVIDGENQSVTEDVFCLERQELSAETLGMTLEESKAINSEIQKKMVDHQIKDFLTHNRFCPCCGKVCSLKGYHTLDYRTLFGKLCLRSPRLLACACQPSAQSSFSPLTSILAEHISPELSYLESKWASLMSYGMTVKLLEDVLPLKAHPASVIHTVQKVSERLEVELGEERLIFIEGCQRDWDQLPRPDTPIVVSLDGGYIHAREGTNRKAGWFEAIVGKSLQEGHESRRFGYVTYDTKPTRRLYEMLNNQGLQMNQELTFLTDGGDNVRSLPLYLSPRSEHFLDWFHITMKITVIKQMSKNTLGKKYEDFEKKFERIKWFIWHGNVFQALQLLDSCVFDLESEDEEKEQKNDKLYKQVEEFYQYIQVNSTFIPNYADRYNHGETISSSIAESTVNELISKRMAKKQQMRWTKKGAHLLLQVRIKTIDHALRPSFEKWYPNMRRKQAKLLPLAA